MRSFPHRRVRRAKRHVLTALALAGVFGSATGAESIAPTEQPVSGPATPVPVEQRLAGELMRASLNAAAITPLNSTTIDIACLLANEAVSLQPESASLWRLLLDVATLAERDDLRTQAIEHISRLDPADENVRLQKINLAFDRFQTVEERLNAYDQLLIEENVSRLGPAVASRLAYDCALLKQRVGDIEGFAQWLTRSLELDRSNRAAAAMAAGFFRANVDDPLGRAEMLINLIMADPTDVPTQELLAELLLDNGAYTAAQRVYDVIRATLRTRMLPASTEFMASSAIAHWAAGDIEGALGALQQRQAEIDEIYRAQQARSNRELTIIQIGDLQGPTDPSLAAVEAVIQFSRNNETAAAALAKAVSAAEVQIESESKATPPASSESIAAQHLQVAFLILWLGGESAKADEHTSAAAALQPLSDNAESRFNGWRALRAGDFPSAIATLEPLAADDAAAGVGLALALEQSGRVRDAASQLLALHRSQPGSMIGIWAAEQLTRIVGKRVSLSPHAAELERLIASIPRTFDRYARDASVALTLRLTSAQPEYRAYDPMLVTIELTNNTIMPLSIDRAGPLRPGTLVAPTINTAAPFDLTMKPFIVDLDSRLRLMPRESVSATVDLRWYSCGGIMNVVSSIGGILKLGLNTNFIAAADGAVVPGLYGLEIDAPLLRFDGALCDLAWFERMKALLESDAADQEELMIGFALTANALHLASRTPSDDAELREAMTQSRNALPAGFARLEPARQAWTLMVMNRPAASNAVLDIARKSSSRLVQMAYLLAQSSGAADPMFDAARRGDDPVVRELANLLSINTETPQP